VNHKFVIAFTFNEFQVLYASSEIRIARYRLVAIPTDKDGNPDFSARSGREVLERAPHFDVEAEHSIIVGVIEQIPPDRSFESGDRAPSPISADVFYLPIRSFESFHSLTERGERILSGRLEGFQIDLKHPLFENDVIETINEWSLRRSLAGGRALVELITGDSSYNIELPIADKAIAALNLVHSGRQLPIIDGSFLDSLLCYERHEALPREDIAFLMDLGLVLKDFINEKSTEDPLASLRNLVKALTNSSSKLSNLINLPDLKQILEKICPVKTTMIPLTLSALFIRWKHLGLNSNDLDVALIAADIKSANDTHSPEQLKMVIWLFGLYWGIDRLVPDFYYRIPGEYNFLLKGKKVNHKITRLSEVKKRKTKSPVVKNKNAKNEKEGGGSKDEKQGKDQKDSTSEPKTRSAKKTIKGQDESMIAPEEGKGSKRVPGTPNTTHKVSTNVTGNQESKEPKIVTGNSVPKDLSVAKGVVKKKKKKASAKSSPKMEEHNSKKELLLDLQVKRSKKNG